MLRCRFARRLTGSNLSRFAEPRRSVRALPTATPEPKETYIGTNLSIIHLIAIEGRNRRLESLHPHIR
jgi:hypothetical protein